MNKEFLLTGRLIQLKSSIHKWFRKGSEESTGEAEQVHRNAEELIWAFQERMVTAE